MSPEIFAFIRGMDKRTADTQIALHCAPFLAGVKIASLLIVENGQLSRVRELLQDTELSWFLLYESEDQAVLLLYREKPLQQYLEQPKVRQMLGRFDYRNDSLEGLLSAFALRYQAYRNGIADFPHEMGLFLGYPVADVRGFIENGGKNFLYSGYWKVYQDKSEKIQLFHQFDRAKESFLRLLARGFCMAELLKYA